MNRRHMSTSTSKREGLMSFIRALARSPAHPGTAQMDFIPIARARSFVVARGPGVTWPCPGSFPTTRP